MTPCPTCSGRTALRERVSVLEPREEVGDASTMRSAGEEHRRIEQIVMFLAADPGADGAVLSAMALDLAAHLDADDSVLYPALERALNRPLTEQRALRDRMRRMLSTVAGDAAFRSDWLRKLRALLLEHARFEEGVALAAVDTLMSRRSLNALWRRVCAARAASLARHAKRGP
jgi:hypothetical protein